MRQADPFIVEKLNAFVETRSRAPLVWGVSDCVMTGADWCVLMGHDDPAAALRGAYATCEAADAILEARGGLLRVMSAGLAEIGLCGIPARMALTGDLGCVRVRTPLGGQEVERPAVGIRQGDFWTVFTDRGFVSGRETARTAWRMTCRRR